MNVKLQIRLVTFGRLDKNRNCLPAQWWSSIRLSACFEIVLSFWFSNKIRSLTYGGILLPDSFHFFLK